MPTRSGCAIVLAALLGCSGDKSAAFLSADLSGYYEGTAKSTQAGDLEIAINLRRVAGEYEGELRTSMGDFAFQAGVFEGGRLRVRFDFDGEAGTLEAELREGILEGTFRVGEDSGTVRVSRVGDAKAHPAAVSLTLDSELWREDLRFFARELPKRHANAFHHVSRERFESAVVELDRRLDGLTGDEVYVSLNRIATLVGDAHTYVQFPRDKAQLPLELERFDRDYRVVRVAAGLEQVLGARVVQVHATPIERAREILMSMTPGGETQELAETRVTRFLTLGMVLHGFGIIPDREEARLTLADDEGREFSVECRALPPGEEPQWVWVTERTPLYREKPTESFWYTHLPDADAVYCNFRGYRDLDRHARGLLDFLREKQTAKLVIDLRENGGGNYTQGEKHLIDPIRQLPHINARGRLFVLIGPRTLSAAMANAAQFRSRTAALLVGQTIGERPNSDQEVRQFTLPNSRLVVRYSTRYYQFVEEGENAIRPDLEVAPTWAEYKNGRDPVLERVLKHEAN